MNQTFNRLCHREPIARCLHHVAVQQYVMIRRVALSVVARLLVQMQQQTTKGVELDGAMLPDSGKGNINPLTVIQATARPFVRGAIKP